MTDPVRKEMENLERELAAGPAAGLSVAPPPGSSCWMDQHRICAADCTAWNSEHDTKFGDGPESCVILVSLGQVGPAIMALGAMQQNANKLVTSLLKKAAAPDLNPPPPRAL